MYSTSVGASLKLIGTMMRPLPLTPKKLVSSRAELCDRIATRAPTGTPSSSSPAACDAARAASSEYVSDPHDRAGWSGSSTTATRCG
ncbi:unannotated protein [freshwater metagenome]|uniref:Unannotated protein n=1 Tax=freshwater metagenome TaxID=449393 RepID=A0A6J7QGM6_9ZZZZ